MRRFRWLPACAGLLLVPALAHAEVWDKTFRTAGRPTVRILVGDARVTVQARPGAEVAAHVEHRGKASGLVLRRPEPIVRLEQHGDVVEVEARYRGSNVMLIGTDTRRLEVTVSVPAECDVEIDASDGAVSVTGTRGRVRTDTDDGRLTLRDLHGDVSIAIEDGRVDAAGLDGTLSLEGTDGPVSVSGRFDALDVDHDDGRVEVEVLPGSKLTAPWSLSTEDGRLALALPRDLRATVDARSQDGRLVLKLPSQELTSSADDRSLRFELNGGGPLLKVRTQDGGVTIATTGRSGAGFAEKR